MVKGIIIRSIFALGVVYYTSMFTNFFRYMIEDKEEERKDPVCWINLIYSLICATMLLVGLSEMGV